MPAQPAAQVIHTSVITAQEAFARAKEEIARNSVESKRLSELIDYATLTPLAIGLLATAFAIEDSSTGI